MGYEHEIREFASWYNKLDDYGHKVFIAGNHDWGFQNNVEKIKGILTEYKHIDYVQDELITIQDGDEPEVKIWGSPWQPEFYNWAFNLPKNGEELKAVWETSGASNPIFGALVRMLILTGQRREEVAGMKWECVSDDMTLWTIPGTETKNGKAHLVPLSPDATAILAALAPKQGEARQGLVFVGRLGTQFSGWSKCKADLDEDSGVADWRIHDLRRTLATGLQRLGVRLEVTEAVLNHISGSRAGLVGVYQRHDWKTEKAAALNAWAAHVRAVLADAGESSGNVVRLPVVS
jgi:hypothetical protein